MTDPDVEREMEANKQRARNAEQAENDDGPIVDTLGTTIAPVTRSEVLDPEGGQDAREDDRSLIQKARDAARTPD